MSASARRHGHPVWGGVTGCLLFLFVAADLLFFGVLRLNSPLLTILPVVGLFVGVGWGLLGPLGSRGSPKRPVRVAPVTPARSVLPAPAPGPDQAQAQAQAQVPDPAPMPLAPPVAADRVDDNTE
jgi:hypothetical protein